MSEPLEGRSRFRPGEKALDFDPGQRAGAGITFVGLVRSDWKVGDCPKNLRAARERPGGGNARVEIFEEYWEGLLGLQPNQPIMLLYWMHQARRDLILQQPSHLKEPRGTFALRSPARPNPISIACVQITDLDLNTGVIGIDAIDCFDGTPLLDLKPWKASMDVPPGE